MWEIRCGPLAKEYALIIGDEFTSNIGTVPFHTAFGEDEHKFDFLYKNLADMIADYLTRYPSAVVVLNEHNRTLTDELQGMSQMQVKRGGRQLVDKEIFPAIGSVPKHTIFKVENLR